MGGRMKLSCLCGQLRVETAKRPDYVNECNCTLCAKTGAQWAYFHPDEVTVTGEARGYSRADKDAPNAEIRFCETCGATTHFVLTEGAVAKHGNTMMGVNMRLADASDLAGVELRFPDGRAWDGASAFGYVREAVALA
jgi:hypothetical protein